MDPVQTYREIIKQVILKYAQLRPSHGDIHLDPVVDETRDNYALMLWDRVRLQIIEGCAYLEVDGSHHQEQGQITRDYVQDLENELGVTQTTLARWETGKAVPILTIPQIILLLNRSTSA